MGLARILRRERAGRLDGDEAWLAVAKAAVETILPNLVQPFDAKEAGMLTTFNAHMTEDLRLAPAGLIRVLTALRSRAQSLPPEETK